ncbi:MAG: hypothetical protein ABSG68_20250 [Thermoguttaceae bacterium]|jgi:predicted HicB family RNase H-like nuclease
MKPADERKKIQKAVRDLFRSRPDWATFYREILGSGGIVRRLYPTMEALREFEETEEYRKIQRILRRLRKRAVGDQTQEQMQVITIRIPQTMRDVIVAEAHEHQTSMNKLCVSKLLQYIDHEFVPDDLSRKPKRRKKEKTKEPEQ